MQVQALAPTDEEAMEIFYEISLSMGEKKCDCGDAVKHRFAGDRSYLCGGCEEIFSFTSGTMLARVKRFQAYFAAFLLREAGLLISALAFSRLTGVNFGTALNIQKKISLAMANQMDDTASLTPARPLQEIIARRSRETPARMHPFSEQEEIELAAQSEAVIIQQEQSTETEEHFESSELKTDDPVDPFEAAIKAVAGLLSDMGITAEKLSLQTSISFGLINGALTMLEMNGEAIELPGGKFIARPKAKKQVVLSDDELAFLVRTKLAIALVIDNVQRVFHRVSRKALQLYLAAIWCAQDRERWGEGSVLQLCFNHPPIRYKDLLNYVSPPQLKIMHLN